MNNTDYKVLEHHSAEYPKLLHNIYDYPEKIYIKGQLEDKCIAIVGTRGCSSYGRQIAYEMARDLAKQGLCVVSGLARGIDTAAHKGALSAGSTLAVLPGHFDQITPVSNTRLAEEISKQGALITEYGPNSHIDKINFVARNRIIAGISMAVIVIEAPKGSGSLMTADFALGNNMPVMVVPGLVSTNFEGSHSLIRQGATLISSSSQVLSELRLQTKALGV